MTNIADDLLDELETLEQSTDMLQNQVQDVENTQTELKNAPNSKEITTAALLLEAIKATQKATENSQESAQINLRISDKQQAHLDDLQDIALSSRQAMRNTSQDNKSVRNFVAGLSVTAILMLGGITAVSAWFFYENQNQQKAFEQSILDIIKTENALNQRQLSLKINELASIIEVSMSDPNNPRFNFDATLTDDLDSLNVQTQPNSTDNSENLRALLESTISEHQQQITQLISKTEIELTALKNATDRINTNLSTQVTPMPAASLTPRFNALDAQLKAHSEQLTNIHNHLKTRPNLASQQNTVMPSSRSSEKDFKQLEVKLLELTQQQHALEKAVETLTNTINEMQKEFAAPAQLYRYRNPYEYSN